MIDRSGIEGWSAVHRETVGLGEEMSQDARPASPLVPIQVHTWW